MSDVKLNGRLGSAAAFVRQKAVLADIGTDHAYLPLFLLSEGRIDKAYATDINAGPLRSAEENAIAAGFTDKVTLVLTDGAAALADKGVTDYTVCGMGGELIAEIIDRAPHLRREGVRLILQPMTKQAHLREYLLTHGFAIRAESYSYDAGKHYLCIMAEYSEDFAKISETPCTADYEIAYVGAEIIGWEEYFCYLEAKLRSLTKAAVGKERGGEDNLSERRSIDAIRKVLESKKYSK